MDENLGKEYQKSLKGKAKKRFVAYVDAELKELIPDFQKNMYAEIKTLEEIWNGLSQHWDIESASTLAKHSHKLAGSSGSFGFMDVYKSARALEVLLKSIMKNDCRPYSDQTNEIFDLLKTIKLASNADIVYQDETEEEEAGIVRAGASHITEEDNRLIYLVEDDVSLRNYLKLQIGYFGYDVQSFESIADFLDAAEERTPAAIIMDISFPEDDLAGTWAMQKMKKWGKGNIPVIFISVRDDLEARLEAVRANGCAYFTKPINVSELIDKLDLVTSRKTIEAYRVLVIDDDLATTRQVCKILERYGYLTEVINNPLSVMKSLYEFKPDIILLDVYMPECTGMELASVIRQQTAYISVPIIFLSVEKNTQKQLSALSLGGDDFLAKPISEERLIAAISVRIERARILRSYMRLDGLTGVLNHTAILEQLEIELTRERRSNGSLAFAMIDLDYFKRVNDTYGHRTGDKVLKHLSRMLKRRLRRTDIIGRYGGEEFAVILLDTDEENAFEIMDGIRKDFSQVYHYYNEKRFTVSFSCGVSVFPKYPSAVSLTDSADKALYQAKNKGRNQVILTDKLD